MGLSRLYVEKGLFWQDLASRERQSNKMGSQSGSPYFGRMRMMTGFTSVPTRLTFGLIKITG
jgi:hypothetical protein